MMRLKSWRWRPLFLLSALLMAGCGQQDDGDTLVVGMELAYRPFEMTDEQGDPTGISVDLARAMADHMDKELVIRNIPFDGLIPALKTGKIDLILSSMTATEERAQSIDFSDPYVWTGLAVLADADGGVSNAADMAKPSTRIAVKQGTTGQQFSRETYPDAELLVFDDENACVLEVIQGKADAFIYDQMSVYKHWRNHRDDTRAILEPLKREAWALGIRKGNDALRASVNAFLADFRESGGFERLATSYLGDMRESFALLGYDFIFSPRD